MRMHHVQTGTESSTSNVNCRSTNRGFYLFDWIDFSNGDRQCVGEVHQLYQRPPDLNLCVPGFYFHFYFFFFLLPVFICRFPVNAILDLEKEEQKTKEKPKKLVLTMTKKWKICHARRRIRTWESKWKNKTKGVPALSLNENYDDDDKNYCNLILSAKKNYYIAKKAKLFCSLKKKKKKIWLILKVT